MSKPTSEQITKWAQEAGFTVRDGVIKVVHSNGSWVAVNELIAEFSALAYAAGQTAEQEGLVRQEFCKMSLLVDVSRMGVGLGQKLEREACAKTCEDFADGTSAYEVHHRFAAYKCADLIRKRGRDENIS